LKRLHFPVLWLAIIAVLIDGLLPTAVAAATGADHAAPPLALCSSASGAPSPGKNSPVLPVRHCALCAAFFAGLLPGRPGALTARRLSGAAHPSIARAFAAADQRADYRTAQPRAPPQAA
jgi:hypothetical protein